MRIYEIQEVMGADLLMCKPPLKRLSGNCVVNGWGVVWMGSGGYNKIKSHYFAGKFKKGNQYRINRKNEVIKFEP
jgi:hypothetical protein